MFNYLSKLLILVVFSGIIIYNYYFTFPVHNVNFNGYTLYLIIIGIIYAVYKIFNFYTDTKKVSFTPLSLFLYFLLHLFILSGLFFSFNKGNFSSGFILFFKIISYGVLPFIIITISSSIGYKILGNIKTFHKENSIFKYLSSLGLGFFLFLFLIAIFGVLGFYNIYIVLSILIVFLGFSYKQFLDFLDFIFNYKIEFRNHDFKSSNIIKNISPNLISSELIFIIATFLLSVNLINIVRPFPIGWDDLGVYMNYPRVLASSGTFDIIGGMFSWQSFTGIGFMLNSANQAFFLNAVGGFLSFIVTILVVKDLLFSKDEKISTFINIPLLVATIFISMPMVIFQQAKDMKLDPGLFFVSLIGIYMFYYLFKSYFRDKQKKEKVDKTRLIYFLVIGLILGLAFTIKFTSLILVLAIFGALFFIRLGVSGFLGFLSFYFAIFSGLGLWERMNVIFPKDDYDFRRNFSIILFVIGIMLLTYSKIKYKKRLDILLLKLGVIILGLMIAVLPWVGKNIYQADNISVGEILSGKTSSFEVDYKKIYSDKQLDIINNKDIRIGLNSSGTTSNEDYGRYFGYEKGINNYLKLPWNLTMQKNQGGEFTDITFIFLALIPVLFLFLPYRRKYYGYILVIPILLFELSLFIFPLTSKYLTNLFSTINLPLGYFFILLSFLIFLLFRYLLIKGEKNIKLFKINLVFTLFYTFLWTISAFGIVWYGIMMYFGFLFMIAISLYYISITDHNTDKKESFIKFIGTLVVFILIMVHFFFSSIPNGFNNLKFAGYKEFKTSDFTSDEAIFTYHKEYLKILYELNIAHDKKQEFISKNISKALIQELSRNEKLKSLVPILLGNDIENIIGILNQMNSTPGFPVNLKSLANKSRKSIYAGILRPKKEFRNQVGIYRIGTFLKYFIHNNISRLLEDNLVTNFDKYIYDENIDKTVERIKKMGLGYFLVDLNAATIDKDPRHDLTRRYENLLKIFTSDKLELVKTDSACLRVALEKYKKSSKDQKSKNDFLYLASVNSESYLSDGTRVKRDLKLYSCFSTIIKLIESGSVNNENYSYLINLQKEMSKPEIRKMLSTQQGVYDYFSSRIGYGHKVLFKVK